MPELATRRGAPGGYLISAGIEDENAKPAFTVTGTVPLVGGTATVTAIGPSGYPLWPATSSYTCICSDTATTPAACSVQNTSTSSITIKGTGTDVISYSCTGTANTLVTQ